jgi:hypothetical protein
MPVMESYPSTKELAYRALAVAYEATVTEVLNSGEVTEEEAREAASLLTNVGKNACARAIRTYFGLHA